MIGVANSTNATRCIYVRSGSGLFIGQLWSLQTYILWLSFTILAVFVHKSLIGLQSLNFEFGLFRCVGRCDLVWSRNRFPPAMVTRDLYLLFSLLWFR
ncbi:hypothetical protein BDR03DRAFT_970386 [Suillus americanus]|nr:hypothetical protein BDR03DRAFT_970386 [Suillus americanus]